MAKNNGQVEQTVQEQEIQIDVEDLRVQLGIDDLESRIAALEGENKALRSILSEYLTYVNYIDDRVQGLEGQKVVTRRHKYNIGRDGTVQKKTERPAIPANLLKEVK